MSKKKIGFYCWKIFIFDYFRVLEVSFKKLSNISFLSNNFPEIFFTSDTDNDCGLFSQDYRNVYSQQKLILK